MDIDKAYSENIDYITVTYGIATSINRKNLEWRQGTPRNLGLKMGKCSLIDTSDKVVDILKSILKDNLNLNKI